MAAILTAEDVVLRIAAECAYVDERGGVAFRFEPRGPLDVKGKGPMKTYFLYRSN
jgi:hypothetical protein